jgi:AraC-like DNA-binding protein
VRQAQTNDATVLVIIRIEKQPIRINQPRIQAAHLIPMDRLSPLFARSLPSARVFYSGTLCQTSSFEAEPRVGHLHLLRRGAMVLTDQHGQTRQLDEPCVLFFARASAHRLSPVDAGGVDLVCASVDLGDEARGTLTAAMPDLLVLPLRESPALSPALDLLFQEAFAQQCGRQAALDLLMEYLLILLLRHLMDSTAVSTGILAALADARLAQAVTAMHEHPQRAWSLENLAEVAGMSRARFAHHFRDTTGHTVLDYLTGWRLTVAKTYLKRGKTLKAIAPLVGYASPAALTRVFVQRTGQSPAHWMREQDAA